MAMDGNGRRQQVGSRKYKRAVSGNLNGQAMERYLQDPGDGWRLGISVPRTSYLASVNSPAYNIDPDPGPAKYYTTATSTADPIVSTASTLPPTTGAVSRETRALCDEQVSNMSFADDNYELPCEFMALGCRVTYVPTRLEDWIAHSESHFRPGPLPRRSMCTYCDQPTAIFEARSDRTKAWRSRMLHIAADLRRGYPVDHTKPDLYVLEHLYKHKIISKEDLARMTKYSERSSASEARDKERLREDRRSDEQASKRDHKGKHREPSRHDEKHRKPSRHDEKPRKHSRQDSRKEYSTSLQHK